MAKIELKIVDPKKLEKGTNEERVQMTYGDTDLPIVIDTETAFIECEASKKSAEITKWVVDFDNHKMKLTDDVIAGNYQEIDFSLAMGMVGQLAIQTGIPTLQKLLAMLDSQFVGDTKKTDSQDGGKDVPNAPDSPKPLPNPSPFDEV